MSSEVEKLGQVHTRTEKHPVQRTVFAIVNMGLHKILKEMTKKQFNVTRIENIFWRIDILESDCYRALTSRQDVDQVQWYVFENENK